MSEKKLKKNTPRRSKRAGYSGSKASLWPERGLPPGGETGWLRAAALAAPSPGRLQVALRAKGRGPPGAPPAPSSARGAAARHGGGKAGLHYCKRISRLGERSG